MSIVYTISLIKKDFAVDVDSFVDQMKKRWLNVHLFRPSPDAHSLLQWNCQTEWGGNISGDLYKDGVAFRVFDDKSIGAFSRWVREIIPNSDDIILYNNDLSHQPIKLYQGITDEQIQVGFEQPFDVDEFK